MTEPVKLAVTDLNREELEDVVGRIRDILWPRGKEEDAWTPDTIDAVAQAMDDYHLKP